MDRRGNTVITPQYRRAFEFSEGLAYVELQDGSSGFIDARGRMVVGPTKEWTGVIGYREGFAIVHGRNITLPRMTEGKTSDVVNSMLAGCGPVQYIDRSGKYLTNHWYGDCSSFSEGIGCARESGHTVFLNRSGGVVFQHEGYFSEFCDGLAVGSSRHGSPVRQMYIDHRGRIAISSDSANLGFPFHEGLALCIVRKDPADRREYAGYMDKKGRLVLSTRFCPGWSQGYFSQGLAVVRTDSGCGYIDHSGKLVVSPRWQSASPFSEGLAVVSAESAGTNVFRYIDRTGRVVIRTGNAPAGEFHDGIARVKVGESGWCYIDRQGRVVGDTIPLWDAKCGE
jgi:hypothetical protein